MRGFLLPWPSLLPSPLTMNRRPAAPLLPTICSLLVLACEPVVAPEPPDSFEETPTSADAASTPPATAPLPDWDADIAKSPLSGSAWREIDALQKKKNLGEALKRTLALREPARQADNQREWTLTLMREARLREAIDGVEAALDHLTKAEWPSEPIFQCALHLTKARALTTLARSTSADGWPKVPPGSLRSDIDAAFAAAWAHRDGLATLSFRHLAEVIDRNNFPNGIRPTPSDALAYLWSEFLADRAQWTPEERERADRIAPAELLTPDASTSLTAPDVHPLIRLSAILAELERWHLLRDERSAALEAARVRFLSLDRALNAPRLRAALRAHFEKKFGESRDLRGFAVAMHALAASALDDRTAGSPAEARRLAQAGWDAFPGKLGGKMCDALVDEIERPRVSLEAMATAAPQMPSIRVTHAATDRLFFRAYALDARARFLAAQGQPRALDAQQIADLIAQETPTASWQVDLGRQSDFREKTRLVTPPIERAGAYLVLAALDESFDAAKGPLWTVNLTVSTLITTVRQTGRDLSFLILDARDGSPIPGARVELFAADTQTATAKASAKAATAKAAKAQSGTATGDGDRVQKPAAEATSNANGEALIRVPQNRQPLGAIVHHGEESILIADLPATRGPDADDKARGTGARLLLERDSAVAGERLGWKAIAFERHARDEAKPLRAGTKISVELLDARGERLAQAQARLNAMGTAHGQIEIPTGATAGEWTARLVVHPGARPLASMALNVIPAPTAGEPVIALRSRDGFQRIGRAANFDLEALTAEGQPLAQAQGRWRLFRETSCDGEPDDHSGRVDQIVDAGQGVLDETGHLAFSATPTAEGESSQDCQRYRLEVEVNGPDGSGASLIQRATLARPDIALSLDTQPGFLIEGQAAELTLRRHRRRTEPSAGESRFSLAKLSMPSRHASIASPEASANAPTASMADHFVRGEIDASRDLLAHALEDERIASGTLTHDARGLATIALPALQAGAYRLRCETRDAFGERLEMSALVLVASPTPDLPLKAVFLAERKRLRVGDRLRLLAHSDRAHQKMFLELFRQGRRIHQRWLTAKDSPAIVERIMRPSDRGTISARLTLAIDGRLHVLEQTIEVLGKTQGIAIEVTPQEAPGDQKALKLAFKRGDGRPMNPRQLDISLAIAAEPPALTGDMPTLDSRQENAWQDPQRAIPFEPILAMATGEPRPAQLDFDEDRFQRPIAPPQAVSPARPVRRQHLERPLLWHPAPRLARDSTVNLDLPTTAAGDERLWIQAIGRDLDITVLDLPLSALRGTAATSTDR